MKSPLLATSLLATSLLALPPSGFAQSAQPAPAPGAPAAGDIYDMPCSMFRHNQDGSWQAAQPMTLQPASGPLALKPTSKFKAGKLFAGFDLAKALDESCLR